MLSNGTRKAFDANRGVSRALPASRNISGVTSDKIRSISRAPTGVAGCGLLPSQEGRVYVSSQRTLPQKAIMQRTEAKMPVNQAKTAVHSANTIERAKAHRMSQLSSKPIAPNTAPKKTYRASHDSNHTLNHQHTMRRAVDAYQSGRMP